MMRSHTNLQPIQRSDASSVPSTLLRRVLPTGCTIALAALPQPLNAQPVGDISVTMVSQTISDGVSFTNAKSIPSAVIDYRTRVANRSTSPVLPNGLIVTHPVPLNLMLYVGDVAGSGSGPTEFIEGALPSQLICIFAGLAAGNDCIEFSNDGGATFGYQPTADAGGYDAAVTHFRIRPQGLMAPAILEPSSFEIRYRMKVK